MTQGFTADSISSRVDKILKQQIGGDISLSPHTNLQEDLGMDSLELVELGLTLENEFAVPIPDAEVRRCITFEDIVQLVGRAGQEQEAKSA